METIGIITCCFISVFIGMFLGSIVFYKDIKRKNFKLRDYQKIKLWKIEKDLELLELKNFKRLEQKYNKLVSDLRMMGIDDKNITQYFQHLFCEMGDLIHGIAGWQSKLDDKTLVRNWQTVETIALAMRHYPVERPQKEILMRQFFDIDPNIKQFLALYSSGCYTHIQFLSLCSRLLFGNDIKESLKFAVQRNISDNENELI